MPRSVRRVHLLGICGTAMAALAGCLQARGMRVTGSDAQVYPPMSEHLAALGIRPHEGFRAEHIPADTDLVVVGNVVRADNPEAEAMRRRGLPYLSMPAAVRRFAIGERRAIAVVGTHGKTTTTALAAHTLTALGMEPGFLVGGIAANAGTNFASGAGDWFVIEGDEYDTAYFDKTPKFFKYGPHIVLFTSLEYDHADIYPDLEAIRVHFRRLIGGLPADGLLLACTDDPEVRALAAGAPCPVITYGESPQADCRVADIRVGPDGTAFHTVQHGRWDAWRLPLAGRHNALNAAAVALLARHLGHGPAAVARALAGFRGVRRRQEVRGEVDGVTVLDDFAHHPTAVRVTVEAMRGRYPGRRLWAVFEPRSFTARSARFQDDFAAALAGADRVLLAPPHRSDYSAGIRYLDTAALAATLRDAGVGAEACAGTGAILERLAGGARPGDVVLIMSNGGFDDLHTRLLDALATRGGPPAGEPGAGAAARPHSPTPEPR